MIKSNKISFLLGTLIGTALGSTGTILVMKKMKKLNEKHFIAEESEAINEVRLYYENKIEDLKKVKIASTVEEIKNDIQPVVTNSTTVQQNHKRITLDKVIDEPQEETEVPKIVITNPKFIIQDENGDEIALDPSDLNQGDNVLEVDKGFRPNFDYSNISKVKYTDLQKEYDREPIQLNEVHFPVQITKREFDFNTGYKKIELMYYEQNGVFTTMDDEICDEYKEEYFGIDNILKFNSEEASLDGQSAWNELYLRDDTLKIDYCLVYTNEDVEKVIGK